MLFNIILFLTVLHFDSKSVFEGVAVDEGSAFDGCGAALPINISFHIFGGLGTDGCGPALLNDFLVLGVDLIAPMLWLRGHGWLWHSSTR